MTKEEAAEKINWLYYEADYGNNLPDDMEMAVDMAIKALREEPEAVTLTYDEKCIFLSAISRERRICQEMDAEDGTIIKPLVPIVDTIIRKVKTVLWGEDNG